MKCPKCGKELLENSVFCSFCGIKIKVTTTPKTEETVEIPLSVAMMTEQLEKELSAVGIRRILFKGKTMRERESIRRIGNEEIWINERIITDGIQMRDIVYREIARMGIDKDSGLEIDVLATMYSLHKNGSLSDVAFQSSEIGIKEIDSESYFRKMILDKRYKAYLNYLVSSNGEFIRNDPIARYEKREIASGLLFVLMENPAARDKVIGKKEGLVNRRLFSRDRNKYSCLSNSRDKESVRELDRLVDRLTTALKNS